MKAVVNFESKAFQYIIQDLMEEANYLPTGEHDWKAILRNLRRTYPQGNYTDAEIMSEIEIFYNA